MELRLITLHDYERKTRKREAPPFRVDPHHIASIYPHEKYTSLLIAGRWHHVSETETEIRQLAREVV